MAKRAEYQVTPAGGRVHKTRNVQPFIVKVGERHGDLDHLEHQLEFALRKVAKRHDLYVCLETTGVASVYTATVYLPNTQKPIATCTVEAVEKDQ